MLGNVLTAIVTPFYDDGKIDFDAFQRLAVWLTENGSDGIVVAYLLYHGPQGLSVDSQTGVVTWSTSTRSPAENSVTLYAFDTRGVLCQAR